MRSFVCILVLLMALLAQAQEMDTTYVIDEQGRTIGLIHEKGTIPRIAPVATPVAAPEPAAQSSAPANDVDSAAYYQDLINRYTLSGEKKRSVGNGMMIGGSVGVLLGVLLMVHAEESTDHCGNNDYGCNDEEFLEFFTGYGAAIAGVVVFGVGVTLKIVGGTKLRRAARYRESLNRYNARRLETLKLQVEPIINARKGAFGSRLSLNF
jgi:hypothetical protein